MLDVAKIESDEFIGLTTHENGRVLGYCNISHDPDCREPDGRRVFISYIEALEQGQEIGPYLLRVSFSVLDIFAMEHGPLRNLVEFTDGHTMRKLVPICKESGYKVIESSPERIVLYRDFPNSLS
ncbi:MAG: hypothetical protein HYW26_04705 [Candidatus Aenigmarchaeota archaeon]|nr:hypothetical protein [Candidatus Aenigmarchaeota archaeon]